MLRLLYLTLLCFVLFMWSLNADMLSDKAPAMMQIALHGLFGGMATVCVFGIYKNGDFFSAESQKDD